MILAWGNTRNCIDKTLHDLLPRSPLKDVRSVTKRSKELWTQWQKRSGGCRRTRW